MGKDTYLMAVPHPASTAPHSCCMEPLCPAQSPLLGTSLSSQTLRRPCLCLWPVLGVAALVNPCLGSCLLAAHRRGYGCPISALGSVSESGGLPADGSSCAAHPGLVFTGGEGPSSHSSTSVPSFRVSANKLPTFPCLPPGPQRPASFLLECLRQSPAASR